MLVEYTKAIEAGTVYLGTQIRGKIVGIHYVYGTLNNTTDLTITTETSGQAILAKANLAAANIWYYPAAIPFNASGAAIANTSVPFWMYDERLQIIVGDGGGGAGTITLLVEED